MVEIVAEAGITHKGSLAAACRLADSAREAGADKFKTQTYRPSLLLRKGDPAAPELEKCALSFDDTKRLARHCEDIGIEFMSTPGELESLKFLVEECGVKCIKIGSDDLTYKPLVEAAYKTGKVVILSTGMATISEVYEAFQGGWGKIIVLHCVSLYPCPLENVNLNAIKTLQRSFACPIGYSDHSDHFSTFTVVPMALALGAVMIEKHICPKGYVGPDDKVSLDPSWFKVLVSHIKKCEKALGMGIKAPCPEEVANISKFRKGSDGFRGIIDAPT